MAQAQGFRQRLGEDARGLGRFSICAKAGEIEDAYVVTRSPESYEDAGYRCILVSDASDFVTVFRAARETWSKIKKAPHPW